MYVHQSVANPAKINSKPRVACPLAKRMNNIASAGLICSILTLAAAVRLNLYMAKSETQNTPLMEL